MKSALIVRGGWPGHQPVECTDVFVPWLKQKGFKVTVSDSLDILANKRRMKNFGVIIPAWTMGRIEREQCAGLCDAVRKGAGIAGWHGGMCDAFRENTEYQFMTGGQFVAHPGGLLKYTVNICDTEDATVRGLADFQLTSEQYYMHTDPGNEVLATTTFGGRRGGVPWVRGTVMPVVWKRTYGKGRVFYSALGHVADEFEVPEVFEIMKRGILWAARERVVAEYKG